MKNSTDGVTIELSLDPLVESYTRYVFKTKPKESVIKVNRSYDIGKLIDAYIVPSDTKPRERELKNPVRLRLPVCSTDQYWLESRYIHVTAWGESKIENGIRVDFLQWSYEMFRRGYDIYGMERQQIIEAILSILNVRKTVATFEAIKKMDYRNREGNKRKISEALLRGDF